MKVYLAIFVLSGLTAFATAQGRIDSLRFKKHYMGMVMSGTMIGCTDCSTGNQITASAYLVNGIQLAKRLGVGIGIGVDGYKQVKTMPLFLHVSEKIMGNKNALLLQLNAGYAWAWFDRSPYPLPNFSQTGGWFIHPAIAYRVAIQKWHVDFSIGYKTQPAGYNYRYEWNTFQGLNYSATEVKNELRRLVIQIGFGWH